MIHHHNPDIEHLNSTQIQVSTSALLFRFCFRMLLWFQHFLSLLTHNKTRHIRNYVKNRWLPKCNLEVSQLGVDLSCFCKLWGKSLLKTEIKRMHGFSKAYFIRNTSQMRDVWAYLYAISIYFWASIRKGSLLQPGSNLHGHTHCYPLVNLTKVHSQNHQKSCSWSSVSPPQIEDLE